MGSTFVYYALRAFPLGGTGAFLIFAGKPLLGWEVKEVHRHAFIPGIWLYGLAKNPKLGGRKARSQLIAVQWESQGTRCMVPSRIFSTRSPKRLRR